MLKRFLPGMRQAHPISTSSQTISESTALEQKSDSDISSLCLHNSKYPASDLAIPSFHMLSGVLHTACDAGDVKCNSVSLPVVKVPCKYLI